MRVISCSSKKPKDYSFGGEDGIEETPIINVTNPNGITTSRYYGSPKWSVFSLALCGGVQSLAGCIRSASVAVTSRDDFEDLDLAWLPKKA